MKRQRGQAFILVLIYMSVGALLITPLLNYAYTALRSQEIFERAVSQNYAADAAIEDVLRQMLDSIQGGGTPEETYDVEFGVGKGGVATVIEIPYIPPSEWFDDTGFSQFLQVMVEVWPPYLEATEDDSTFWYIIRLELLTQNLIENYGWTLPANVHYEPNSTYLIYAKKKDLHVDDPVHELDDLGDEVPPHLLANHQVKVLDATWTDMTLIEGPVISPDPEYPDRDALEWDISDDIDASSVGNVILTCQVTGNPPGGVCYIEPWFEGTGFDTVEMAPCAGLGYGFYIITLTIEGLQYEVIVSYDSTPPGSWNIISYRIVE